MSGLSSRLRRIRRAPTLLVALGILSLLTPAAEAGHDVRLGADAWTTGKRALRSGPSTSYSVKLTVPCGGRVGVRSGPTNGYYRVAYGSTVGYTYGNYLTSRLATTRTRLPTSENVVALTFDAGADRGYTSQILNTLKAEGVTASFGLTGKWVEANPDLARRIVNEGHTVINHTYSHRSFTGFSTNTSPLSYSQREAELRQVDSAVRTATGYATTKPLFRPPYGDYNTCVRSHVAHSGYVWNVMWTLDSWGWRGLTKDQILRRVLDGLQPGANYLFHVGGQSQDGPALPSIISRLRERGYGFTTVP
jgi:peptidoglycan/xylan/chitin deacetylase (PgdA/CDA1 family)